MFNNINTKDDVKSAAAAMVTWYDGMIMVYHLHHTCTVERYRKNKIPKTGFCLEAIYLYPFSF